MLLLATLAPFVVLATRVVAGPTVDGDNATHPVSIPITKRITATGTFNVVENDNRRLRFLLKDGRRHESLTVGVPLNEVGGEAYTADIGFGDPPTTCETCQFRPRMVS
jgi:hypothetical protein